MGSDKDGWWELHRGAYVITYREKVNLPHDLMALARPRSTLLRSGVAIHTAVWDAGYVGRGEGWLEVRNPAGVRLQQGARIVQLVLFRLSKPASASNSVDAGALLCSGIFSRNRVSSFVSGGY